MGDGISVMEYQLKVEYFVLVLQYWLEVRCGSLTFLLMQACEISTKVFSICMCTCTNILDIYQIMTIATLFQT